MLRLISCSMLLSLAACTDKGDTVPDEDPNGTPVADAGTDKTVSADNTIVLDGSGSYDPDGDQITFHWSFDRVPEDSAMADYTGFPGNNTTANSSQLRPDVAGTYIVQLIVKQVDKPIAPPTPVAPVGDGGPAGPSAEEMGLPSSNSAVRMVANKTQLGQTVDYLEAMLKQDKRLRITIEVLDDDG